MSISSIRTSIWTVMRLAMLAIAGILVATGPALAIDVGPETPVGNVIATELGSQNMQAVAAYPGGFLAVYQDNRPPEGWPPGQTPPSDISGVFLDTNGNPVGESFLISGASSDQKAPSVAFNGTNFLVVWQDHRWNVDAPSIYAARVSTTGAVLEPDGFLVFEYTYVDELGITRYRPQYFPAVASNGTDWEVVWERDTGITHDIYGRKVSAAGALSSAVAMAYSGDNETVPAIAWNGSYYVAVYQRSNSVDSGENIYACLLKQTDGTVQKASFLISAATGDPSTGAPGDQFRPRVALGSSGISMAVWQDGRNVATGADIYGARLSSTGSNYDTNNLPLYVASGEQASPSVGWDGTYYCVAWRDRAILPARLYGTRVDTSGNPQDIPYLNLWTPPTSDKQVERLSGTTMASSTGKCVALWTMSQTSTSDVYSCTISSSGTVGADKVVSVAGQDQTVYSAAFDGTNYVVVWEDHRSATAAIYAARVTPFGEVLDPQGVLVSASTSNQQQPAIKWGGGKFLVAWAEGDVDNDSAIKGVRMNSDLSLVDSVPLAISTGTDAQYSPVIGYNNANFLVVWVDSKQNGQTFQKDIMGAMVNPTTAAITKVQTYIGGTYTDGICTNTYDQYAPSVSSNGTNWLVVWQDMRAATNVYYARVGADAKVILGTVNGSAISSYSSLKAAPGVAFDGTNYFVVWADSRGQTGYANDIYGVRLSTTGTRLDTNDIPISVELTSDQNNPSIAWAGDRYFVGWQDARTTGGYTNYDIYIARAGSDGVVADPNGVVLSENVSSEVRPHMISGGTNWAGVFYAKNVYPIYRLQMRFAGDQVTLPLLNIAESRTQPNGKRVSLAGQVVSAGTTQLGTCFYIEDADRTAGLKIADSSVVDEAGLVDVTGVLATVDGERQIINASVNVLQGQGTVPPPLGMTLGALGGTAVNPWIPGVQGGTGLNNVGLLVVVWGKVISTGTGYFMIQDGSKGSDATDLLVKVVCPTGVTNPELNKTVGVMGISSCEPSGGAYVRRVLARKQNDIVTFN